MTATASDELGKLRAALAGLETQRGIVDTSILEPALAALRGQITALEAQQAEAPPAEERRIVSALFSDIVGSTAIAGKLDPEDWKRVVSAIQKMAGKAIEAAHGQVLQYLGDGLLAVFGVQEVSENDAENAVRAALAIQAGLAALKTEAAQASQPEELLFRNELQSIQLRVGVHTGLVVLSELGTPTRKELTATGEAMNLAGRLQEAAPAGGVLISHDTFRYVRGLFDLEAQPLLAIKGKSEPIQTYRVYRSRSLRFRSETRGVPGLETRTVGREVELHTLQEAFQQAAWQGQEVWVQLIGEAGMGKSRLMGDMLGFLALQPIQFGLMRGRAFQGDEKQAFKLVRRTWFDLFQIAEDAPLTEAETRWEEACQELGANPEAAHVLGLLVGLPFEQSPYLSGLRRDPTLVKGRAVVISREILNRLRQAMPVVILLEDLHWSDPSSCEYIQQVFTEPAWKPAGLAHGLFIFSTARPERNPTERLLNHSLTGDDACFSIDESFVRYLDDKRDRLHLTLITLSPLNDSASQELARELLSHVQNVPESVVQLIVQRSEGVPYYVEEMVNWLLDRGIIDSQSSPWQFFPDKLHDNPLPATLQHLLLTRLSGLNEAERKVLQRGAVFGRTFWETGVEALGVPGSHRILESLERRGFVHAQAFSTLEGDPEWSFHHYLQREVTYESILKRERRELHKGAAAWLEAQASSGGRTAEFAGLLAEHTERAGEMDKAARWYLQAGEYAKSRGATHEARRFYDRTLELLPAQELKYRWEALLGRDEMLGVLGEMQARQADDETLLSLAQEMQDDECLARAYGRQGYTLSITGDDRAAVVAYDASLAAARRAGSLRWEAAALGMKLASLTHLGEMYDIEMVAEEAMQRAEEAGDAETLIDNMVNVALYYTTIGDLARAARLLTHQVELSRNQGEIRTEAAGLGNLGYAYLQLGLYPGGREAIERSLALSRSIGARRLTAFNQINLGLAYWRTGDLPAARQCLEEAIPQLTSLGDRFGQAAGLAYLGMTQEKAGQIAPAQDCYAQAEQIFRQVDMLGGAHDALCGQARCTLEQGDLERAYQQACQVWGYLEKDGAQTMEFPILAYLTCAEIFQACTDQAQLCAALKAGYQDLMQRAERISNPAWRQSYLENVPEHHTIRLRWEEMTRI